MTVATLLPLAAAVTVAAALVADAVVAPGRLVLVTVDGESMLPVLRPGDRLLVTRRRGGAPRRGRLVVFQGPIILETGPYWRRPASDDGHAVPGHPATRLLGVKRVAAVAGDPVPDAFLTATGALFGDRVPPGHLLLVGDGPRSTDSRVWGFVPVDQVTGTVVRRLPRRRPRRHRSIAHPVHRDGAPRRGDRARGPARTTRRSPRRR